MGQLWSSDAIDADGGSRSLVACCNRSKLKLKALFFDKYWEVSKVTQFLVYMAPN